MSLFRILTAQHLLGAYVIQLHFFQPVPLNFFFSEIITPVLIDLLISNMCLSHKILSSAHYISYVFAEVCLGPHAVPPRFPFRTEGYILPNAGNAVSKQSSVVSPLWELLQLKRVAPAKGSPHLKSAYIHF